VRALGVILAVIGAAGVGACIRGAFTSRRPRDLAYALAAPLLVGACVLGVVIAFSPDGL